MIQEGSPKAPLDYNDRLLFSRPSELFILGRIFRKATEKICRLARPARGREDSAIVLFQKNDPHADVVGMTELALNAEVRAEECRGEFRDKLLGRVGFRAEAVAEFALEARLVAAPMGLMPISA